MPLRERESSNSFRNHYLFSMHAHTHTYIHTNHASPRPVFELQEVIGMVEVEGMKRG